jgi:putative colanic acid biosynthesis glycosyltransferase
MPKLIQINVRANWGSTGKIAESIGIAAINRGWESYIAYGRGDNTSHSHLLKVGNEFDIYMHYGEQRIRDNEGLCSRGATLRLIRRIQEIKPDVVHLHNIHDHYLNYKLLFEYLNETEIKVVWTFHDFWAITGHCMHFVSKDCKRYQTGCHDCPMHKVYPKSFIDRSTKNYALKKRLFSANKNLTIVPVSQWVGDMVKFSFLKDKPIQVINNGIDLSAFRPTLIESIKDTECRENIEKLDGKYVIMSVASQWQFDKGLEDYKQISKMLSDDEVIVLVGVDEELIAGLPYNIIGIKRITNVQELAALYTRADVVAILSSAETFGLTVVEGYACGTPAVVYDNTAPPSLVSPETGFVVPNKDFKSAYDAIQKIKTNGRDFYYHACIRVTRDKYDKSECVEKYISLYNS